MLRLGAYATRAGFNLSVLVFVAYGISPVCIYGYEGERRSVPVPLPTPLGLAVVEVPAILPYCLMDDLYDLIDAFVLPRSIDWGPDLVTRRADGSLDASGTAACADRHGFEDGVSVVAYAIQRIMGDGFLHTYPFLRFVKVYPFEKLFTAFEGVRLQPGDALEQCFTLHLPALIPLIALAPLVLTAQMYLIYIVWSLSASLTLLLRDVRNAAIALGVKNERIKEAYVHS